MFTKGILTLSEFTDLLKRLLTEMVSIRDAKLILEGVLEYVALAPEEEERAVFLDRLHSYIRKVLARKILAPLVGPDGELRTFGLSSEVEEEFRGAITHWEGRRSKPPISPELEVSLREAAKRLFGPVADRGALPVVLLCSEETRACVQSFFSGQMENRFWYRTISYEELQGGL